MQVTTQRTSSHAGEWDGASAVRDALDALRPDRLDHGIAAVEDPRLLARLADRGYGLQDRISTALEWGNRPDRTPLVDTLVTDAVARAGTLKSRQIIARHFLPRLLRDDQDAHTELRHDRQRLGRDGGRVGPAAKRLERRRPDGRARLPDERPVVLAVAGLEPAQEGLGGLDEALA